MRNSASATHANQPKIAAFTAPPAGTSYSVQKTKKMGCTFKHVISWPEEETLEASPYTPAKNISEISFSRWAENDQDLSGL